MESHILWALSVAGLFIFIFFFIKNQFQKPSFQDIPLSRLDEESYSKFTLNTEQTDYPLQKAESPVSDFPEKPLLEDSLLALNIMAKPGACFASYDLLQAILGAGFQFGEMNIFHYIYPEASYGIKLFSLASAEEPGEFRLDQIGNFSCPGLVLFMDSARVPDPDAAFKMMLEKAEQLAEDLDGQLYADPKTPWTSDIQMIYQNRIAGYRSHLA